MRGAFKALAAVLSNLCDDFIHVVDADNRCIGFMQTGDKIIYIAVLYMAADGQRAVWQFMHFHLLAGRGSKVLEQILPQCDLSFCRYS